jgi:hypothetical protein
MKLVTIVNIYNEINANVFANVLQRPPILAKRWRDAHAQFVDGRQRRLEFNLSGIKGMQHARSVVYHEMIHQYVEEYLHLSEDNHHGPIFWRNYKMFAPANITLGERL